MTGWWSMAGRTAPCRRALVSARTFLVLLTLPVALATLAALGGTAAAAPDQGSSPVSLAITGMTPQWAAHGSTITVTGTLRNTSARQVGNLTVQLLGSRTPVTSLAQLQPATVQAEDAGATPVPGSAWHSGGELAPGASVSWTVRVKASKLGLTAFGVYPLQMQAQSAPGTPLASQMTYLPYEPAKKSGFGRPAAEKIAWLWPLIDKPLISQPWQNTCRGQQAQQLASSLGRGGRLNQLVTSGELPAATARADTSKAAAGSSGHGNAAGSSPAGSLASYDGVTWAIDPALLDNVHQLAACGGRQPQWSRAAAAWLAELNTATAGQPVFATPYGDVNLTALIAQGHSADVARAFELGRTVASTDLRRNLNPSADSNQATGIAWPPGGTASFATLENLAASSGVSSLVLAASDLPAAQATVAKAVDGGGSVNGGGSYVTLLLADDSLTQLLTSSGGGQAGVFATSQEFLAQTALLAQEKSQPIIVAPPQRWNPPAGLAADLLAGTASAPWLSPVTLNSLTAGQHIAKVTMPATATFHRYRRAVLADLGALNSQISELETIRVTSDPEPYEALFALESSAWEGHGATVRAMAREVSGGRSGIANQPRAVKIVAASRVTLGGLKGTVPVSVDNGLNYPVRVRLQLRSSQGDGLKITNAPGLITVRAHTDMPLRFHVQLAQSGSSTLTVSLLDRNGHVLPANAVRMTVQATQVGLLGMIIFAAALGVFLLASAARAVRRGRPAAPAELLHEPALGDDHADQGGEELARPDTVVPELGTHRPPGL